MHGVSQTQLTLGIMMKTCPAISLLSVAAFMLTSAGVAASQTGMASKVERWGMQEIVLHSSRPYQNPFREVNLSAKFTCPGEQKTVTGFYDGDSTWKVRFMPQQLGRCEFQTTSNDPEMNNQSGGFVVTAAGTGNHGPVQVAKIYHFSYSDGTPYFLLGTTSYNWLNRDEALQRQTLGTLSDSPFTKLRFGLFPKWYAFNHEEPAIYPYVETSPRKFDLDRFNPRFFQSVEGRIAELEKMGIEADVILFHPYDHLGFAAMDPDHDDAYIRYVVARLSAFRNVWWTMANEYDLFDPKMTPGLQVKDWDRMFHTLEASDPYHHLRGIHNMADWYDHSKPWITHAIVQDGTGHPGRRLPSARAKYGKPVVVDEYGYEGDNAQGWGILSGAEEVSQHWDITMEGGYGSHGETYVHPGGVLWWAAGGTLVGESPARLGFLKKIMTEAPFQDLVPAPDLVQGGTLLAVVGEYYLLRIKNPVFNQHVEIQLKEDAQYQVDLIDPWLMKVYELGSTQGGLQAFDPPITPSLLRMRKITADKSTKETVPIQTLLARFLKDPSIAAPPNAVPVQHTAKFYSAEYTIGELLDNPKTNALVKKYLPNLPPVEFIRAITVEQLMSFSGLGNIGDVFGLAGELAKTPVVP
jgi:hypothetical protein